MGEVTVITHWDMNRLAVRIRAGHERSERGRDEWIVGVMEQAEALAEARDCFPSNEAFHDWLVQRGLDYYSEHDRAALINMGRCPEITKLALQETMRTSLELIWSKEIQPRLASARKTADRGPLAAPSDAKSLTDNGNPPEAAAENVADNPGLVAASPEAKPEAAAPEESERYPVYSGGGAVTKNIEKSQLLQKLDLTPEQYTAAMSAYPRNRQIAIKAAFSRLLARKEKGTTARVRALFELFAAVAANPPKLTNCQSFDARMFMPHVPQGVLQFIKMDEIFKRMERIPLMNARAEALLKDGASTTEIVTDLHHIWDHGTARPALPKPKVVMEATAAQRIKHEVKFCGEVIWPSESLKHVTYNDLNMGWHLVDYWCRHLEHAKPEKPNEIAVQVQHLIQDIAAASSIRGLIDVMLACMSAYNRRNGRKDAGNLDGGIAPGPPR